jgi:hypothetical protein
MGTRSTYTVIQTWEDKEGKKKRKKYCMIYHQYDGYPNGHPLQTAKWLSEGKVVNGLGMDEPERVFNGAGCLAAQLVAHQKDRAGGVYLFPVENRGKCDEDFLYDIIIDDNKIIFEAFENYGKRPKKIFSGTLEEFIQKYEKK